MFGCKTNNTNPFLSICQSENFLFVSRDVAVKDALFDMSAGANFDRAPPPPLVVVCNCSYI